MTKNNNVILDDEINEMVLEYAELMDMDFEEALAELIRQGVDEVKRGVNDTLHQRSTSMRSC